MKLLHLQNLLVADQPEKRTQEIKLSTRNVVNRDFEGKMAGQHEQRSIRIQGKVIGADANPGKLARALELGANAAYTPEQLEENGLKAPLVIEAAGHPRAFETAVAVTAVGGRTVTVGLPHPRRVPPLRRSPLLPKHELSSAPLSDLRCPPETSPSMKTSGGRVSSLLRNSIPGK